MPETENRQPTFNPQDLDCYYWEYSFSREEPQKQKQYEEMTTGMDHELFTSLKGGGEVGSHGLVHPDFKRGVDRHFKNMAREVTLKEKAIKLKDPLNDKEVSYLVPITRVFDVEERINARIEEFEKWLTEAPLQIWYDDLCQKMERHAKLVEARLGREAAGLVRRSWGDNIATPEQMKGARIWFEAKPKMVSVGADILAEKTRLAFQKAAAMGSIVDPAQIEARVEAVRMAAQQESEDLAVEMSNNIYGHMLSQLEAAFRPLANGRWDAQALSEPATARLRKLKRDVMDHRFVENPDIDEALELLENVTRGHPKPDLADLQRMHARLAEQVRMFDLTDEEKPEADLLEAGAEAGKAFGEKILPPSPDLEIYQKLVTTLTPMVNGASMEFLPDILEGFNQEGVLRDETSERGVKVLSFIRNACSGKPSTRQQLLEVYGLMNAKTKETDNLGQ